LQIKQCKIITILKKTIKTIKNINSSAGFSLVEVLVSILVTTIGAIAAISMQVVALTTTQESAYQSIAIRLASELADQIRIRSTHKILDGASNPFLQLDYFVRYDKDIAPAYKNCFGRNTECTSDEMARFEINEIKMRVKDSLPDGRIQICRTHLPGNSARYDWSCSGDDRPDAPILIKFGWGGKKNAVSASAVTAGEPPPKLVLTVSSSVS
jgi:type IV pilus assembly protein PilV